MLISIIIPFKNSHRTLNKTVLSAYRQNYKNIEILLINNCSKDGSLKIAKKLCKKYSNIYLYHQNKLGVSNARNLGIKKSKGKYLFFLDSDDLLSKSAIKNLFDQIKKNNGDYIISNHAQIRKRKIIKKNKLIKRNIIFNRLNFEYFLSKYFDYHYKYLIFTHCWGRLYKKEIITKNNLIFDKKMKQLEDIDFNFNYIKYSKKIIYIKKILYFHRADGLNKFNRESYNIGADVIYSLQKIYKSIYFVTNSRKIKKKSKIKKKLKHLIVSIFIIFLLRILKEKTKKNQIKFLVILQKFHENITLRKFFNYYIPKKDENTWILSLYKNLFL
tara:strand:+ start:844 stop:1830 length:987 start_codon:yes stop_codon:yes gene_type:complete